MGGEILHFDEHSALIGVWVFLMGGDKYKNDLADV